MAILMNFQNATQLIIGKGVQEILVSQICKVFLNKYASKIKTLYYRSEVQQSSENKIKIVQDIAGIFILDMNYSLQTRAQWGLEINSETCRQCKERWFWEQMSYFRKNQHTC